MRRMQTMLSGVGMVVLGCLGGILGRVDAYSSYHPSNNDNGCYQCHSGFASRGALHDMHVGNSQMTNNCDLCHQSVGDNPSTSQSAAGVSCIGCHVAEGLRLHHINASAPQDGAGRVCTACHSGDGTPAAENVNPPYYARGDVAVKKPCIVDPGSGGEDWSGDGAGLDNDGDLAYDASDTDCATAIRDVTWGTIKILYAR